MIDKMESLAEMLARIPGSRVEFTPFPSGAAMLDVRRLGRLFVLEYSPTRRFGVDEVRDGEGFVTGYRYSCADFESAAERLKQLVEGAAPPEAPSAPESVPSTPVTP